MCKCEKKGNTELKKCHATNDSGSTVQSSSKDKRIEQVSFQQAGTDSVALVLANLKTPTPAELGFYIFPHNSLSHSSNLIQTQ